VGKTWSRSKPDLDEKPHQKKASRHGHTNKYIQEKEIDIDPSLFRGVNPAVLLGDDELELYDR